MLIYLIGFMGSGKTTIGKKIAQTIHYDFIDLDALIEKEQGLTISQIFETKGEETFREMEKEALADTFQLKDIVISCGGGTPCFFDNIDRMNEIGMTVYLKLSAKAIVNRLKQGSNRRPLTKNLSAEELEEFVINKLSEREVFYSKAAKTINVIGMNLKKEIRENLKL